MNSRNRDIFFSENADEVAVITITDENGRDTDAALIAVFEIEELQGEYVVLLPTEQDEENLESGEGEAIIMAYSEDAEGNPEFSNIEDEEEFEIVTEAFYNLMESGELELDGEDEMDI